MTIFLNLSSTRMSISLHQGYVYTMERFTLFGSLLFFFFLTSFSSGFVIRGWR